MSDPYTQRRRAIQRELAKAGLDALVVTHPANLYYLTGYTGEAGVIVISRSGCVLVTDGRFMVQAGEEIRGVRISLQKESLFGSVGSILKEISARRVGFDPGQVSVAQHRVLRKGAGQRCLWVAAGGLTEALRRRKEPEELRRMRRAAALAADVVESALKLLKPGVRELEVGAEIEYQMREKGGSGPAFETIVAFGERSALPHARPTAKRLRKNELVVLDLGVILANYCSDITRTVYVGRAPARVRKWYQAVREAQAAAISAVYSGARCGDVDEAARGVLRGYKLDRYFVHSTGHGLGLEVHEDPKLAKGQGTRLEPGNVVTVEPGVYVPGAGGIRIEDDVAVHAGRTEILTRVPRDLIEL